MNELDVTSPAETLRAESGARAARFHLPHLRWLIAALLLAASVINYIDRQTLSILATTIQRELNINDVAYARIVQAFLFAYTFAYLLSGRIVDRFGPRVAETIFLVWWSIAALVWITNCVTLPIDIFPSSAVGSVHGFIGTGGSLGGAFSTGAIGWMVTNYSYTSVFTAMSFLHPLALVLALLLLPRAVAAYRRSNE